MKYITLLKKGSVLSCIFIMLCANVLTSCKEKEQVLYVSAASSLGEVLGEIGQKYEQETGVKVQLNLGSSMTLGKQIAKGAPSDILVSASPKIWEVVIPIKNPLDICGNELVLVLFNGQKIEELETLTKMRLKRFAIGEVASVPVGMYSEQALKKAGIFEELKPTYIYANSAAQLTQYVKDGVVDGGILFRTDATAHQLPVSYEIPSLYHDPIFYSAGMIKESKNASSFLEYLQKEEAVSVFKKYGFKTD